MKRFRWLSLLFLAALQSMFCTVADGAEPGRNIGVRSGSERTARIAVVIGNSAYPSGALANPRNDASAMAAALKRLGFDVELKIDATKEDMEKMFSRLSAKADKAAVAAVFYAGHGLQVGGANYIVPVDAHPQSERDLKREMIKMDDVIDDMGAAQVKLMFFDACRNNPLARSFTRGGSRGLAAPVEATGTLISFATKHGNTAADGEGAHSPYTTALLAALENPAGMEIEQLLRRVQQGVRAATDGQQEPWRYGSLDGDFFFQAPAPQAVSKTSQTEAIDRSAIREAMDEVLRKAAEQRAKERDGSATAVEISYWDSVKDSQMVDDFHAYLKRYPKGSFADLAQNRIAALGRGAGKQTSEARTAVKSAVAGPVAARPTAAAAPAPPQAPQQLALIELDRPAAPSAPPAASLAPSSSASASGFPQPGDTWTYRYVDAWKKDSPQTVVVKVMESSDARVADRMSMNGGRGADERSFAAGLMGVERPLGRDIRVTELAPYAHSLLREGWKPGQEKDFPKVVLGRETFRVTAKLIGQEKIVVPAGTFDAMRVQLVGENVAPLSLDPLVPKRFTHTLWFVPEIGRVVKVEHATVSNRSYRLDDDSLELVSFSASGGASRQAGAPRMVAVVPPKATPDLVSALPRTGDSWTYRYVNEWKKDSPQTITVTVEESDRGSVTDTMSMSGGRGSDQQSFRGTPQAAERPLGSDVRVVELLPYAQSLLQEGLKPGQEKAFPDAVVVGGQTYRIKAKLIGQEKITVPAGTFAALRVDIAGENVEHMNTEFLVPTSFTHSLWFVPELRRVIKFAYKSVSSRNTRLDDERSELVSFALR